ncbi:MAG: lysozyme inhibitor LprI family protein [Pseudomonadota bacterium]
MRWFVLMVLPVVATACDQAVEPRAVPSEKAELKGKASPRSVAKPEKPHPAAGLTAGYQQCLDTGEAADGATYAIKKCISDEFEIQDPKLNATYQNLMRRLSPSEQQALRKLQREWLKDREQKCKPEDVEEGDMPGTLDLLTEYMCHLEKTVERRQWLERYASQS